MRHGRGETLEDSILAEKKGETQRGLGFTRQVEKSTAKVVIMMAWLDLKFNSKADDQHDQAYWSWGEYLSRENTSLVWLRIIRGALSFMARIRIGEA